MTHWMNLTNGYMVFEKEDVKFYFKEPDGMIKDMAYALSNVKRCVGRMQWPLTHHSELVARLVGFVLRNVIRQWRMSNWFCKSRDWKTINLVVVKARFHDAHEAYLNDIPSPVGQIMASQTHYVKSLLQRSLEAALGIPAADEIEREIIAYCDKLAYALEAERFCDHSFAVTAGMVDHNVKVLAEAEESLEGILDFGRKTIQYLLRDPHGDNGATSFILEYEKWKKGPWTVTVG